MKKSLNNYDRLTKFLFVTFFSIFLFFPSSYIFLKIIFFVFFVFFVFLDLILCEARWSFRLFIMYCFLAALGLLAILLSGYFSYGSDVTIGVRLLFLSVVFYFFFSVFLQYGSGFRFQWMRISIFISSLAISVNIIMYVIFKLSGFPYPLEFLDLDYKFGSSQTGLFAYSTNNLPILMFSLPFMMAYVAFSRRKCLFEKIVVVIALFAAFMSLRNALILVIFLSIFLILLFKKKWFILSFLTLIPVLFFLYFINFYPEIWEAYLNLKLRDISSGEDPRYEQALFWLALISEYPLFGTGIGSFAVSGGQITNPFGYELTYLMFSASVGVIFSLVYYSIFGFVILGLFVSYFYSRSFGEASALYISLFFGMFMFLIASATNGYLMTLGYLWTVFIPMAFLLCAKRGLEVY